MSAAIPQPMMPPMYAEARYIPQALRSRSVTRTDTTMEPMRPSPFEKKKNMYDLHGDNREQLQMFPSASVSTLPGTVQEKAIASTRIREAEQL